MIYIEGSTHLGNAEILPLLTKTLPPYTTTNTIVYGQKNFVVLDPGTANLGQQEALAQYLYERIRKQHRFLGIFLTHYHGDHVNGATFLRDKFNAPIYAHKNAQNLLKFSIDLFLEGGQVFTIEKDLELLALYTPGHSEDHLTFYDAKYKILMAGDLITDRGTVLIPPETGRLKYYLESLERISYLPINILIPAHGLPITKKVNLFLLKGLKHRFDRIISVFETLNKNKGKPLSARDVTSLIYRNLSKSELFIFAQLSVESSLLWLHELGLIENFDQTWQLTKDAHKNKEVAIYSKLQAAKARIANLSFK